MKLSLFSCLELLYLLFQQIKVNEAMLGPKTSNYNQQVERNIPASVCRFMVITLDIKIVTCATGSKVD